MKMLKSQRPHLGIFGRRNVGKSSFINALVGQDISIVSDTPGTTTDPVDKTMEISGIGPVVLIDTAGFDDEGELGEKRIEATFKTLRQIDLAILVFTHGTLSQYEKDFLARLKADNISFVIVHNKEDLRPLTPSEKEKLESETGKPILCFSSKDRKGLETLLPQIKKEIPPSAFMNPSVLGDLVKEGDIVVLVTPIDKEAPQGRLILPQVQTIRDCLDQNCVAVVLKERELDSFLKTTQIKPKLVVTDSQAFLKVDASISSQIPLTSFSILFARLKGDFELYIRGTRHIGKLKDEDRVLILESCAHHSTGDDIGRVKIPRWLSQVTGSKLHYDVVAGLSKIDRPITDYSLVVQCGGCMLSRTQVLGRLKDAVDAGVPVTNYGMAIAYSLGIFERAIAPFDYSNSSSSIDL